MPDVDSAMTVQSASGGPVGCVSAPETDHSSSSSLRSSRNWAIASSSFPAFGFGVGIAASVVRSGAGRGRGDLGAGLRLGRLGRVVVGKGDAFHLRLGLAVVEFHLEFFLFVVDGDGVHDGGVGGFGLGSGLAGPAGAGLAELRHPKRHRADGHLVAGLQDLLSADSLAIDECPVGAAEVTDRELAPRPRRARNGAG